MVGLLPSFGLPMLGQGLAGANQWDKKIGMQIVRNHMHWKMKKPTQMRAKFLGLPKLWQGKHW
jgi:hypothetical protein